MAASAGAIRAGAAFVELFAEGSKLDKGLQAASAKLKAWGATVSSAGRTLFAGGLAGLTGLGAIGKSFADSGSEIADFAGRTGMGTDAIQGLKFGAEQTGADLATLETGVRKMQDTIANAAGGSKEASAALRDIGLSASSLAGLSPEEQFARIADGLKNIPNAAQRTAAAMNLFGKSGTQLIPLLSDGAAGLKAFQDEADRLGLIMPPGDIANADALGDAIDKATSAFGGLKNAVGAALAPVLTEIAENLASIVGNASKWIAENRGLVVAIGAIAAAATAAGAALIALGAGITAVGAVIGGVTATLSAIGTVIGAIASPVGLVVAALAAGTAAWFAFTESGQSALQVLSTAVSEFGGIFRQTFAGIVDALSAGNIGLAGRVAMAGLKTAWAAGLVAIDGLMGDALTKLLRQVVVWAADAMTQIPAALGGWGMGDDRGDLKRRAMITAFDIGSATDVRKSALEGQLQQAQDELDKVTDEAREARAKADDERRAAPGGKGMTAPFKPPADLELQQTKTSSVGTFSAQGAAMLGGNTVFMDMKNSSKKTAENSDKIAKNTEATADKLDELTFGT